MPRPWSVTLAARRKPRNSSDVFCSGEREPPRRKAVASANPSDDFCRGEREPPRRKAVASANRSDDFLAASVNLHGTRPWHPQTLRTTFVAASVNLHGTRPWHPQTRCGHHSGVGRAYRGGRWLYNQQHYSIDDSRRGLSRQPRTNNQAADTDRLGAGRRSCRAERWAAIQERDSKLHTRF